ncbi:uncharacterized protein AstCC [Euwallacea similis]|uniref:uncharacterized protein AstCC n=1 Tax=Euwallacea similis TaxID=1736056 RepID=UPI00344B6232
MYPALILFLLHCLISLRGAAAVPVETSQLEEASRAVADRGNDDYPDYQIGVRYDEYPTIVPKKRTALLVNRLMVALKEALEEEEKSTGKKGPGVFGSTGNLYSEDVRTMDLQRRGHQTSLANNGQNKARLYWRCYFNAVTCF